MIWEKSGEYALRSGNWTISRALITVEGKSRFRYSLWDNRKHVSEGSCGTFDTSKDAMREAARLDEVAN